MKWSVLDQSPSSAGSTQDAALARRPELDEIVINTWTFDPQARRHSYSLLAEAFGLGQATSKS